MTSLVMSLDVVGSLGINVDLIVIWNCEINHKSTKEYVKSLVVMPFHEPHLPFYDPIRNTPEFIKLVEELKTRIVLAED